ncbi:MAG: hypothetical protein F6K65_25260 [Moorea sp. SIO3C2]|nr:hypothetical protein [Moorena sp. SIO3C2]
MQRLNERVSPTRALHQDNTLTRSLIKTTVNRQPWPLATLREQPANRQPSTLAFGHATRTTLAFGHATRTTVNLGLWPRYANNLGLWPRYANNRQPWPLATLREQPANRQQIQTLVKKS